VVPTCSLQGFYYAIRDAEAWSARCHLGFPASPLASRSVRGLGGSGRALPPPEKQTVCFPALVPNNKLPSDRKFAEVWHKEPASK